MMGVPLMRTKLAAYAVGAALGGIGGVAYATLASSGDRRRLPVRELDHPAGDGRARRDGQRLGRAPRCAHPEWINSTGLVQFGNSFNSAFGTQVNFPSYNFLIFGLLLILMMLFRRAGLLPEARTKRVLQEPDRVTAESLGADLEGTDLEETSV